MSYQKITTYALYKKMRDEVSYVANRMYFLADRIDSDSLRSDLKDYIRRLNDLVDDISLIPRNCDVGTAEEQYDRCAQFCKDHNHDCKSCPLGDKRYQYGATCELYWAQMPYEPVETKKN